MRIAVVGLWHQGVVGAACLAAMGHDVVGTDFYADVVRKLSMGAAPLFEPNLDALLADGIREGRLTFTTDLTEAVRLSPFVFLMFDTPVNDSDQCDLSVLFRSVEIIAPALQDGTTLLITAQVPVGTCDAVAQAVAAKAPGRRVSVAYMPENLRLGEAIACFMAPSLGVIGADEESTFQALLTIFGPLARNWRRVSVRTAEMVKHTLNAFLATSVSFANELGNICDALEADGRAVGEILRLDPRIGAKAMLLPGLAFSGGTLARDVQSLRRIARDRGVPVPMLDAVWASNAQHNQLLMRKISGALPDLKGARVAILGLTYKPGTSTLRRSAAVQLIADLSAAGAIVSAHDPKADRQEIANVPGITFRSTALETVSEADALVLMTPWSDYGEFDFSRARTLMAGTYVLDTAGLWDPDVVARAGFFYDDIGRGRRNRMLNAMSNSKGIAPH